MIYYYTEGIDMAGNNDEITLQPKNGKKHMLFTQIVPDKIFGNTDNVRSSKLEKITSAMQDKGYEIVDVKYQVDNGWMSVLIIYQ